MDTYYPGHLSSATFRLSGEFARLSFYQLVSPTSISKPAGHREYTDRPPLLSFPTLRLLATGNSFIWDVYDAVLYQSAGFVVHGLACLVIFAFSFVSTSSPPPSWGLVD